MEKQNKKQDTPSLKKPLYSMTGYACVEKPIDHFFSIRVEIKSLNHRYLDIKVKIPREFNAFEIPLRQKLQNTFTRGSIDFKVEFTPLDSNQNMELEINKQNLGALISDLQEFIRNYGFQKGVQLESLLSLPGMLTKKQPAIFKNKETDFLAFIDPLLTEGIEELVSMKKREGEALHRILKDSLQDLQKIIEDIQNERLRSQSKIKEKITKKIQVIFEAYPIENTSTQTLLDSRISQELAYLLEKSDIEEELKRLSLHTNALLKLLSEGSPMGRKFEFLTQELHREINTLGNKSQESEISDLALKGKILIDQMKEQSLNIE